MSDLLAHELLGNSSVCVSCHRNIGLTDQYSAWLCLDTGISASHAFMESTLPTDPTSYSFCGSFLDLDSIKKIKIFLKFRKMWSNILQNWEVIIFGWYYIMRLERKSTDRYLDSDIKIVKPFQTLIKAFSTRNTKKHTKINIHISFLTSFHLRASKYCLS